MQKSLKVLFTQATTLTGGDTVIHSIAIRSLDRKSVDVHVACNYGNLASPAKTYTSIKSIPDITLKSAFYGSDSNFRSIGGILRTVFVEGPAIAADLVKTIRYIRKERIPLVHFTERSRDAGIGLLVARASGAKAVLHVHSKLDDWHTPLVRSAMRHADARIAVSQFVRRAMIDRGIPAENTFCVHNGIDITRWDLQASGAAIRDEFHVAPDTVMILMIARMNYYKGTTRLLRSLSRIKNTFPNFKALFVGEEDLSAPPGESRGLEDLRRMSTELGLGEHVVFTGRRSDTIQLFAASDIYAMPSHEEPFGVVYVEAGAMHLPVVSLNNGGTPEVVVHGVTGLLSEPEDELAFDTNLLQLLQNPALRNKLGQAGRQRAEQYLNMSRMGKDIQQVYETVLRGAPAKQ